MRKQFEIWVLAGNSTAIAFGRNHLHCIALRLNLCYDDLLLNCRLKQIHNVRSKWSLIIFMRDKIKNLYDYKLYTCVRRTRFIIFWIYCWPHLILHEFKIVLKWRLYPPTFSIHNSRINVCRFRLFLLLFSDIVVFNFNDHRKRKREREINIDSNKRALKDEQKLYANFT